MSQALMDTSIGKCATCDNDRTGAHPQCKDCREVQFYTVIFTERGGDYIAWGLSWYDAERCANYAHENIHANDEYAIALVIETN